MADFETHDRGTARELLLLRTLASAIDLALKEGLTLSLEIERIHKELISFYESMEYSK